MAYRNPFQSNAFERASIGNAPRGYVTGNPGELPPPVKENPRTPYRYPNQPLPLTVDTVADVIPDSIGSLDEIAKRMGRRRIEVRRFIEANDELLEMIEEERRASVERVMKAQYEEAMDGNPQARESYIKMASGFFSKKQDDAKEKEPRTQVVIHMEPPQQIVQALDPETGELVDVDARTLLPVDAEDAETFDGPDSP